jgi:hypothetical protein
VQIEPKSKLPFANYSFDILVVDLSGDSEEFDWRWITDRRDPSLSAKKSLSYAPKAWKRWVESGKSAYAPILRSVAKQSLIPRSDHQPAKGSREAKILAEIYGFYVSTTVRRRASRRSQPSSRNACSAITAGRTGAGGYQSGRWVGRWVGTRDAPKGLAEQGKVAERATARIACHDAP